MAKTLVVTPEEWLPKGETVVNQQGQRVPLVIWGGIVGEEAHVRLVHRGQNQNRAVFEFADPPSPERMQVPCEKVDACGGCPMMHVSPKMQHSAHVDRVRSALNEAGLPDVEIEGWTPSSKMFDFRHVVKLGWGWSFDGQRVKIGAFGRRDKRITPIPKCDVASPVLRRVMTSLAHHALKMGLEPYDPDSDRGVMRGAIIRASSTTGEVMVTLIAGRRPRSLNDLAEEIVQANGEIVGVWVHINDEEGNGILSPNDDGTIGLSALMGKDWIEEDLDGISLRVGPGDFYQTNPFVALPLYQRTLDRLELSETDAFVDLYCGVGGLTLLGARRCGHAIGIEGVGGAVQRARESARRNRLSAEFIAGRVEDEIPALAGRVSHPKVAVDPARRGLEPEVLNALIAMRPSKLAYISCNPRALARDLAAFRAAGAIIEQVELFDMFPHTAHVECLTTLSFGVEAGRAPRRTRVRRA